MNSESALRALAALAQENRLAVFRLLVEAGPAGRVAGQIAEGLGMAGATLSFHLRTLSHGGLVKGRQEGRFVRYVADFQAMAELIAFLSENCCGGDPGRCGLPGPPGGVAGVAGAALDSGAAGASGAAGVCPACGASLDPGSPGNPEVTPGAGSPPAAGDPVALSNPNPAEEQTP